MWNLWHGCHKKSEGCQHCYVFKRDAEFEKDSCIVTKRPERILQCLPEDWGNGYENVTICCTMENQRRTDERLPIFRELPILHKAIISEPLLERIDFRGGLGSWAEQVTVGGESGRDARVCDYDWVLDIRRQYVESNVSFHFKQTGALFRKDGHLYRIPRSQQMAQARKSAISYSI